jgi:hypothetical protein
VIIQEKLDRSGMRHIWEIRERIIGYAKRNLGVKRPLRKYGATCEFKLKICIKKYDAIERSGFLWHMT